MIIVYGARKKVKKIKPLGIQECPNCGHRIDAELAKETGYCHIYYIPVFPLLGCYKFIACPYCGISKKLTSAEFKELKQKEEQ